MVMMMIIITVITRDIDIVCRYATLFFLNQPYNKGQIQNFQRESQGVRNT